MNKSILDKQANIVRLLNNSYKKNRLVHVYLFSGEKGTPKKELAEYLAMLLLCTKDDKPCFKCKECKNVINHSNPNVFYIENNNQMIKKEQIESLKHEFLMTPLTNQKRIFIIENVERTNPTSANMLLKFLEELDGDNYGVLTTDNIASVLPTIRSRSEIVTFNPISKKEIIVELIKRGATKEKASVISFLTNGIEQSILLLNDEKLDSLIELSKKIGLNTITKERNILLILNDEGKILLNEKEKKYHEIFIDLLISFANDKLFYTINELDKIIYKDTIEMLSLFVNEDYQKMTQEVQMLLKYKQRLKYNVNIELLYYEMFLEMMR